jgi:hypothetical protein
MKKSAELRQELNGLVSSQDAIMKKAEGETRALSTEETASFDSLQTQITEKRAAIQREEQREENLRSIGSGTSVMDPKEEPKEVRKAFSLNKAIRSMVEGTALEGPEKEARERGQAAGPYTRPVEHRGKGYAGSTRYRGACRDYAHRDGRLRGD